MRAAVIGSGFGGLALAIRLQASGIHTCIYEKRDQPGGRAYAFQQDGFTFDSGPTMITGPELFAELFELGGKRLEDFVELVRLRPFYRLVWDDFVLDYSDDGASVQRQIAARSPDDAAAYERFMAHSRAVCDAAYPQASRAFESPWSMLRLLPDAIRFGWHRSVFSQASRYFRDERVRQAFSFHPLFMGGSPYRTPGIFALIPHFECSTGVWFAKGGMGALVRALVRLFESLGGELRLSTPVERIEVSNNQVRGVTTARGSDRYDLVCSNADVLFTYETLLAHVPSARRKAQRFRNMTHSISCFLVHFGTRRQYPDLHHHTIYMADRYQGLLDDIFTGGELADDFSVYLYAPCRTDPSLAPPGCDAFYALSPVPNLQRSAGRIDWAQQARPYADRILSFLEQRDMPGLRDSIVTERIFTPEDFRCQLDTPTGSSFSIEPTLRQSGYFRPQARDKQLEGLYLVGAATHPGASLPAVLGGAKAVERIIAGRAAARAGHGRDQAAPGDTPG
jgi:phytoene desaturase